MLGRDPAGLWIGTFHSLSARLLRREAELLGFTRAFTIYDEDDREALVRRLLESKGHSPKTFTPRAVSSVISAAKNRMQSPEDLAASSPFDRLAKVAADVYSALGPAMQAANAMDFDDLMLHPLRAVPRASRPARRRGAIASPSCWWTSSRTPTARSTRWCAHWAAGTATSWWWVTTTSRSTAGAAPT